MQNTSIFARRSKKEENSQKNLCRTLLTGSLKRRK